MKLFLFIILLISLLFISCSKIEYKEYTVLLIFCDNRPETVIRIKSYKQPSNSDIKYFKQAVPTYKPFGYETIYFNVCDIKVLGISK